jgi:hypothetical protein
MRCRATASNSAAKARQIRRRQGHPGGHRVAAEAGDQIGAARVDLGQRVTQVEAGDGTRRTAQLEGVALGRRAGHHRPMQPFLQLRGDQADHTGMPVRLVQHDAERKIVVAMAREELRHHRLALLDHRRLQLLPLRVDCRQPCRQFAGARLVVGEQALDAQAHVLEPTGGVHARTQRIAQIGGDGTRTVAAGGAIQRGNARAALPGADPPQTRGDEDAVVRIQRHQVGDRAQRDEVEQRRQIGSGLRSVPLAVTGRCARGESAALAQMRTQRQQQVEHDADAGQRLARKRIPLHVRIHDRVGRRHGRAGQMVIGHDHADAARTRGGDAGVTGDAVVDGEDQVRWVVRRQRFDQRGGKPVTFARAMRNAVTDVARAEQAQAAHGDRGAGGAVAVEVADDADAQVRLDRAGQQFAGEIQSAERSRRGEFGQPQAPEVPGHEPARGIYAREQRMHLRRPGGRRRKHAPADRNRPHARRDGAELTLRTVRR